ncbi:MAG: Carbohydrate kinase PfkB family [Candidatus Tokpelaia hoelldobleri]|uniref:Carbohydrate kinase PfkB family n=1 Tax=Candidatus Tokpelaia hoelldobleri TaxID=1902579 RepID=A0A1U9JSR4_9HYPH|nr:MAG: Carbohydrate kinase PfkB family [Candidatus Tokpelaia hoelldoblerii]
MSGFDVLAIGNAIVDIVARTDEDFILVNGIIKGAMNLIDADRAELLYKRMVEATETSGGSAANTAAGIASLGGKVAFMGKVAADHLGQVFANDLRMQGVAYDTRPQTQGAATARSMIFVTPDGERSMNTYLGACKDFGPEDIEADTVAQARVTYFEGYLWDAPRAREAIRLAAGIARKNGNEVAITLSDPFCVDRYRDEFLQLIRTGLVSLVFANEDEAKSLYQTDSFDTAIQALRTDNHHISCVTRSEKGAIIVRREENFAVPALAVDEPVDVTGAGDLFAAGFLYGYTNGLSLLDAAHTGTLAASYVIQQIGPRIPFSLRDIAVKEGLIEAD